MKNVKVLSEDPESIELARHFTVRDYKDALMARDKNKIADAIHLRFEERYIRWTKIVHGFTMMAISCLMIEALESFRYGWPDTKGKSRSVSQSFS